MTLGSWFPAIVYIPLQAGNRRGELLTFRNLMAVWFRRILARGPAGTSFSMGPVAVFDHVRRTAGVSCRAGTAEPCWATWHTCCL